MDLTCDNNYEVRRIGCAQAKEYIIANHYSHGCHNAPSPCYGLFEKTDDGLFNEGERLIGVLMFATPCSEAVRESVFGKEYKNKVIELHRLHILDVTPRNTESWFISRCFQLLLKDKPEIRGIISFSDLTEGHQGTIYKATNAYFCGMTSKATFYMEPETHRLHHPRQNGHNMQADEVKARGWIPVKRESKFRYIFILGENKRDKQYWTKKCLYDLTSNEYEKKRKVKDECTDN